MKTFKFLLAGVVALMAIAGCEKEKEAEHDDYYYAQNATISSSSSAFSDTDGERKIHFKVSGGEVKINVNCGTEWTVNSNKSNFFTTTVTSTSVTVTAGQNFVEEELTGNFSLLTTWAGIGFATINVTQDAYGSPEITVDTNKWHTPAVGYGLTTTIGVEATGEWSFENNADWLTVEKTETGLNLAVMENNETEERVAEVVLTCADEFNSDSETIKVTQDGLAYITLDEEALLLSSFGSTKSVAVESNFGWDYSYDTSNGWFAIEKDEKESTLSITYEANETGAAREGIVTLATGDGAANVAEAELKITQSWENFDALILEYTITSNDTSIQLPICANDTAINWDDGSCETTSTTQPTHKYSTPGVYAVTINGRVSSMRSYKVGGYKSKAVMVTGAEYLTAVIQWGNTGLTDMRDAFWECKKLKNLPEETGDGLANVTTFEEAFYECTGLESAPSFEGCSSATTFENAFYGCTALTTVPEKMFSGCTAATTFYHTFRNCSSLVSAPSFEGCVAATTFEEAFTGCSALTTVPEKMFSGCTAATTFYSTFYNLTNLTNAPSFEGCSSATTFERAFYGCSSLTTVPENMFSGCTAVTSFDSTFYNCSSLVSAPSFEGCAAAKRFDVCFNGCSSLTTVPLNMFSSCTATTIFYGTFRNCSSLVSAPSFEGCVTAKTFNEAFSGCSALTTVPENMFSGCASVTTFESTFSGCTTLTTVPENMFSGCTALTSFGYTFYGCSALKSVPVCLFDDTFSVTYFGYTFDGCSSVVGESPYTELEVTGEKVKVHLYERSNYAVEMRFTIPTGYSNCFRNSTFSDIDSIPSSWGGNGN